MTSNLPNKQAIVMIMPFCDAQITTKQASVMNSCHSVMYKQASVMIMPFCDAQITTKQASVMNSCHSVMYKQASVMIIPNKQTSNRDELMLCFHS